MKTKYWTSCRAETTVTMSRVLFWRIQGDALVIGQRKLTLKSERRISKEDEDGIEVDTDRLQYVLRGLRHQGTGGRWGCEGH